MAVEPGRTGRLVVSLVAVAVGAVVLAGCGGDGEPVGGSATTATTTRPATPPSTAPPSTAPPSTERPSEPVATAAVDWGARTADVHAPGWAVMFCEGEAPLLCLSWDGRWAGAVEHVSFPVGSIDVLAGPLAEGDAEGALAAFADDYVRSFTADRAEGCAGGYEVRGAKVVAVPVGDGEGVRYGFTGTLDGVVVERNLGFAAIEGGRLHLVTAAGLADEGCLAREGELTLDQLDAFAPHLAAIAAGSTFPAG